jgi:arylsulfatase A-like enzyme
MIIKWPAKRRRDRDALHYNLDWTPTLAELLGQQADPVWDGQKLRCDIKAGATDAGREELIAQQCAHVCQRSVRWDNYLYMRTYPTATTYSPRRCCSTSWPIRMNSTTWHLHDRFVS